MNKCMMIHETVLKDILDIWDDLKNISNEDLDKFVKSKPDEKNPMRGVSSIAKASSNTTLVFPVICSRGISIENASMVSKAIEKNAVTMMQRMFSLYNIADERNAVAFLNKFHGNISSGVASLDDVFNVATRVGVVEQVAEVTAHAKDVAKVKADMANLNFYLPSSINESSLMKYTIKEGAASATGKPKGGKVTNNTYNAPVYNMYGNDSSSSGNASNAAKNMQDARKSANEYFRNQVTDAEFKKANELMPTMMHVSFSVEKENGENTNFENVLVAVKAKLYPVSSDDVVNHLAEKTIDRNWLTNFFRATTREISFMKDFVLALDKAKIDAMSLSTRKSSSDRMWKVLERRATNSRLKRAMRQNNASSAAITTLCVSQEEVEYLRKNYNVDIERVSVALGLFDALNLMCICIVDESMEVAKFIYDENEPMWETISFTHLERESSDNTYKKVVNLMTKVSR